jgi:hypothetical protein
MKSSPVRLETAKSGAEYTVRTRCPQCGRKHITVLSAGARVRQLLRATGAVLPLREALRLPAPALVHKLGATSGLE